METELLGIFRMRVVRYTFVCWLAALGILLPGPVHPQGLEADVQHLLDHARELDTAWPWKGPIPEVRDVAKHGKSAAPILVKQLRYGPHQEFFGWDLHVEQQVELALCMIFGYQPVSGETVYGIRSSDEKNGMIKGFWQERVRRFLTTGE